MFFFFVNQYLYAIKNNNNLIINSEEWLFKYKLGWEDYFKNININNSNNIDKQLFCDFNSILGNYKLIDYKNILNKIYIYNEKIINLIEQKKKELQLTDNNYSSIFSRRGDKLISESNYIKTYLYLEYLLSINPKCNVIYLQTDDYNCFLELKDYIKDKNLNIIIITLCKEINKGGIIIFNGHKRNIIKNKNFKIKNNIDYIEKNMNSYNNLKSIDQFNNDEIYEHTINMIIGIDLVLNSSLVITDYSSNVSRFIKLKHNNSKVVYDVISKSNYLDFDKYLCPSFGF